MDYRDLWKTLKWRVTQELRNERYSGVDPVGLIELQKVLNWMDQLEDKPDDSERIC